MFELGNKTIASILLVQSFSSLLFLCCNLINCLKISFVFCGILKLACVQIIAQFYFYVPFFETNLVKIDSPLLKQVWDRKV